MTALRLRPKWEASSVPAITQLKPGGKLMRSKKITHLPLVMTVLALGSGAAQASAGSAGWGPMLLLMFVAKFIAGLWGHTH